MEPSRPARPRRNRLGYRVVRPDRFLRIEPVDDPVQVLLDGLPVASSAVAQLLHEGDRPPVVYLPVDGLPAGRLTPSSKVYHCRWKGEASYFDVHVGERCVADGAWRYAAPPEEFAVLAPLVAFRPDTFEVLIDGQPLPVEFAPIHRDDYER